jgi:hypothetical protein
LNHIHLSAANLILRGGTGAPKVSKTLGADTMTANASSPPKFRAAVVLALIIATLQAFNAFRAFSDPAGFASYLGLPLADPRDAGLIQVYGLRAAFIAALVAALLAFRQWTALFWMAAAAIVMPVGDALLTSAAGAPASTVARHGAIAAYLAVTAAVIGTGLRRSR